MARVPLIQQRGEVPEAGAYHFDAIAGSRGRIAGPFAVLLHSPEVAGRAAHLGSYLRFESTLPPAVKELAILAAAREFDCEFEWSHHVELAREAGAGEHAITVVAKNLPLYIRMGVGLVLSESEGQDLVWRTIAAQG